MTRPSRRAAALLRAINVGGHVVKMDRLRAEFEAMGLARAETLIASGNVVFDAPAGDAAALEARIEHHLERALGYPVATFVRSADEMAAVLAHDPFGTPESPGAAGLYVGFLKAAPDEATRRRVLALATEVDAFDVHGREVYWLCRVRFSDSQVRGGALERALLAPTTMRNVTTVRKLAAKLSAGR